MDNNTNEFDVGFSVNTEFLENEVTKPQKINPKKELIEWLGVIASALIIVVILFGFIFRIAVIDGDSMKNTLYSGEVVVITNFNYKPERGDIVVISRNVENTTNNGVEENGPIIKRVIAVEFDIVKIDDAGVVYVNGTPIDEPYISSPTRNNMGDFPVGKEVKVPQGHIFVLGDNRAVSLDSRSNRIGNNGMIDTRYVLGHAVFRVSPFNKMGGLTDK